MTDLHELFGWCVLAGVFVSAVLLSSDLLRRFVGRRLVRAGDWTLDHLRPVEEVDPLAEVVAAARRRERLVANVERLRRIVATDMAMSATRQLGNRLAFASLLRELAETPEVASPIFTSPSGEAMVGRWSPSTGPGEPARDQATPSAGTRVEVLELGWGR